jgi:hypothetical protein
MRNNRLLAGWLVERFTPSSHQTEIVIVVGPNPKIHPLFASFSSLNAILGKITVLSFPNIINSPVKDRRTWTLVVFTSSMFFTTMLGPKNVISKSGCGTGRNTPSLRSDETLRATHPITSNMNATRITRFPFTEFLLIEVYNVVLP